MEGEAYVFMDAENYEQYFLESDMVGDTMKFVRDNQQIALTFFERTPVAIDLPTVVVLKVAEAEMSAKGNTVNQDKKRAVCETGLEIKVPPFIDAGEYIKVSTETGEFMSRAKETDL
jgi:elongation factor P